MPTLLGMTEQREQLLSWPGSTGRQVFVCSVKENMKGRQILRKRERKEGRKKDKMKKKKKEGKKMQRGGGEGREEKKRATLLSLYSNRQPISPFATCISHYFGKDDLPKAICYLT